MKYTLLIGLPLLLTMSLPTLGAMRDYGASADTASWNTQQSNQLACQLTHTIPNFGEAYFTTRASKSKPLQFTLDMLVQPDGYDLAGVYAVPPVWKPGQSARTLTNMKLLKQFDSELDSASSWLLLSELEKGNFPTFHYQDWQNKADQIKVFLSSVRFRENYVKFLQCRDQMLPFSFDDIAYTVMTYQSNSSELTRESKKRLDKIGLYLKNDPEVESVYIASYTDSYGGRYKNQSLSEQRAKQVKAYMIEQGVEGNRITVEGFGEKRHVATNNNILGRNKNRRVVIQITKPEID